MSEKEYIDQNKGNGTRRIVKCILIMIFICLQFIIVFTLSQNSSIVISRNTNPTWNFTHIGNHIMIYGKTTYLSSIFNTGSGGNFYYAFSTDNCSYPEIIVSPYDVFILPWVGDDVLFKVKDIPEDSNSIWTWKYTIKLERIN